MDKRSITSAANGKQGGRPKEMRDWDGGLDGEVWKPIICNPSYFASNMGRIVSAKKPIPQLLSLNNLRSGYRSITMFQNKKTTSYLVHRLILETFKGSCPDGMEASHKDGNRLNNRLDNLTWESHRSNMDRKLSHETILRGEDNPMSKLKDSDVRFIKRILKEGTIRQSKIAAIFDVSDHTISEIAINKRWKHIK